MIKPYEREKYGLSQRYNGFLRNLTKYYNKNNVQLLLKSL